MFGGYPFVWPSVHPSFCLSVHPSVHPTVRPIDQPTDHYRDDQPTKWFSVRLAVHPSVLAERFPSIFVRMYGRNGLKYGMLMHPDHPQNWLDLGHGLFSSAWRPVELKLVKFEVSWHFLGNAFEEWPEIWHADVTDQILVTVFWFSSLWCHFDLVKPVNLFRLRWCPCLILWGWQHQAMSNIGSQCISI